MNFFIRCALCATFVSVAELTFAQPLLTMDHAVRLAQENDPWLDGSLLRQQATEAQSLAAGALPDPTVSIGFANVPIDSFDFGQEPMTQAVVGVGQTFPRGDTRKLRRQQLLEISVQQPLMRSDRRAKVAVTVSQLWLESYRYSETIRLIEQDRSLFDYLADVAESAYSNALGHTSQQDVIRAQVELTRLDDRLAALRQQNDVALAKLSEWLPSSEMTSLQISGELPELSIDSPQNGISRSALSESEITHALLAHPSLQVLDQTIQASSTGVALAKQKYKPQWGVNASYGYRDDDPTGADRADFFSIGVSFDVPLFTGNRQDQELRSAIASQEATKTDKALALRTMRASLDSALSALDRLNQRRELYEGRLLNEVHDQAEATLNAYTNDNGDFAEVMRARIAELNTNIDFLNIRIDRLKTIAEINYFFPAQRPIHRAIERKLECVNVNNSTKKTLGIVLAAALITGVATYFLTIQVRSGHENLSDRNEAEITDSLAMPDDREPLYWVAPMDPNYQRDEPGKSPMGMDLIPVYASEAGGVDEGIGTIRISPDVVNNLGVRTSPVERRELNAEITTVGYVQYDEDQLIHVHPRVEGWVETLFVKAEGDPIEAGEPLYQLYSPPLVNAQEELLLAIGRGNPRLIEAAEERLKALQIDDKVIDEIKRAGSVQQQITFYSPMSGVVDNLNIREGFYVQPGTTLLSIGSLDQVWVEAEVFERQAALVELGLPVSMTLDYLPGREWQGEVDYIYPSLDNKSRTLRVRLRFDNADGLLKPNMYAQVVIQVALDAPVLAVPRDAVIRTGNQNRLVLALGEGYYKSIAVDLGRVTQEYVEILNGVEEGEAVVTSAQFLLDSESSKTSDFKRLHHGDSDTEISAESNVVTNDGNTNSHDDNMSDMVGDEDAETVWVEAEIKSVTPETRVLSAEHEPVPQWQWPSMTMNFFVAEEVDFNQLQAGTQLHMQIGMRADGQYEISAVHIMSQPPFNDQPSMDAEGSLPAEGSEMTDHSQHQMMHNE